MRKWKHQSVANGVIREFLNVKRRRQNFWARVRNWAGGATDGVGETRQEEKTRLSGAHLSVQSAEPQPENTDAGCSLHQPASHRHRDFHLNRTLICNTMILAYIPCYVTLNTKSWPQSAKQPLSRSDTNYTLDMATEVCQAPENNSGQIFLGIIIYLKNTRY